MNRAAILFYSGTLISSVGSFTFNICLVAFLAKAGFDLFHVSLILGLQRLVPILITGGLGHRTDQLSPKKTVVLAETGAALATIGILYSWTRGPGAYWSLLAFSLLKTTIVSFQLGSKAKLTKLLADNTYLSNSHHAIWFNKATQGANLFAGFCAWPIIQLSGFSTAIWFDLITFALNGLIVWSIAFTGEQDSIRSTGKDSIFSKFRDLYRYNRRAVVLDLLLAVAMMGTVSLSSRFAGEDKAWVAILMVGYGASVWIAGFLEKSQSLKAHPLALWSGLGTAYALLGIFPAHGTATVILALFKDTFYWLLYHRISSHIQSDTPQALMGSVSSARLTQMILILATGELLVGSWATIVPVLYDGLWRATFCFVVCGVLALPKYVRVERQGYARL